MRLPLCITFIPNQYAIDPDHPGSQAYYDSLVSMWADQGIDFIYFDGVISDCGYCHIGETALIADSMKRLGNGEDFYFSSVTIATML